MRDKRAAKCFKYNNNNLVLVIICFSRFVSLVSVVSFRWFRFVVSGFSTCQFWHKIGEFSVSRLVFDIKRHNILRGISDTRDKIVVLDTACCFGYVSQERIEILIRH